MTKVNIVHFYFQKQHCTSTIQNTMISSWIKLFSLHKIIYYDQSHIVYFQCSWKSYQITSNTGSLEIFLDIKSSVSDEHSEHNIFLLALDMLTPTASNVLADQGNISSVSEECV